MAANKLLRMLPQSLPKSIARSLSTVTRSLATSGHQQPQETSGTAPPPPFEKEEKEEGGENPSAETSEGEGDDGVYVNKETGEVGGPKGPEPTRYGDWERGGRCSDF